MPLGTFCSALVYARGSRARGEADASVEGASKRKVDVSKPLGSCQVELNPMERWLDERLEELRKPFATNPSASDLRAAWFGGF